MEIYQVNRMALIKKLLPRFGDNLILKGGTALTLFYGCPRFSENIYIDTEIIKPSEISKLVKPIPGYKSWDVNLDLDTPFVKRIMIDYGENDNPFGPYPLKIEVSSRNHLALRIGGLEVQKFDGISVYFLKTIAKMKTDTFLQRERIRDLFDLGYLLKHHIDLFTTDMLITINEGLLIKGIEELALQLKIEVVTHKLANIDAEKYVLQMFETVSNRLYEIGTNLEKGNFVSESSE